MQFITIKKKSIKCEDKEIQRYYVPALSLKNSDNKVKLLVPHPNGNDVMEFETLEEAAVAIKKAGFEYKLPDGEKIKDLDIQTEAKNSDQNDIEKLLYNKFKTKTNDMNSSVVASAITALAYLNNNNAIDIFIEKIGEDNEKIRNAAIDALITYGETAVQKLIDALTSPNWVCRNSAISCLVKISENPTVEPEQIIVPVINRIDDENTIVQANAILAAGKIYSNLAKRNKQSKMF